MPYVSARYAPPDATGLTPEPKDGERPVIATDDQGVEWQLTENSEVGDWLRFMESESFAIQEAEEPEGEPDA